LTGGSASLSSRTSASSSGSRISFVMPVDTNEACHWSPLTHLVTI
jgi:hypothetical protein